MKEKIAIWGASGHAMVVADIIRLMDKYAIECFIDDLNLDRHNTIFCGSTIWGGKESVDLLLERGIKHIIFGFGNGHKRLKLSQYVCEKGFKLATAIHPHAVIAGDVRIGHGTVICAGAVVNSGTIIGENVIINTCASVDHECIIGNGASICPGVHLAGGVAVGEASWVGIGATVIEKIKIGSSSLIGAGAVVVRDIPNGVVAYGVPARVLKRYDANDL